MRVSQVLRANYDYVRATNQLKKLALLLCLPIAAWCQTIDDGLMIPKSNLFTGYLFTHDSWDHYWEGPLFRTNGNLGTVTTQTSTMYADYGVNSLINVIGSVNYVWTAASQGVLAGQQGFQDLTLAAKYRLASLPVGNLATAHVFIVPFWSVPLTNYTPDFMPLSIGTHSDRGGIRSTVFLQSKKGFYINATGAYTWRDLVHLDRPYYFTNNQFFSTIEVNMPPVVDYAISPGFLNKRVMAQFTYGKIITQGGETSGDIRRQDQPFVSNRIVADRVGGMVMVPLPWLQLTARVEYSYVIAGRNLGQSNTITTGLLKNIQFGHHKGTK